MCSGIYLLAPRKCFFSLLNGAEEALISNKGVALSGSRPCTSIRQGIAFSIDSALGFCLILVALGASQERHFQRTRENGRKAVAIWARTTCGAKTIVPTRQRNPTARPPPLQERDVGGKFRVHTRPDGQRELRRRWGLYGYHGIKRPSARVILSAELASWSSFPPL